MTKHRVTLDNMHVIPEEMIVYCANQFAPEEDNTFRRFLDVAKEFRRAGLTPVFLSTEKLEDLMITTQEKLQKKLH